MIRILAVVCTIVFCLDGLDAKVLSVMVTERDTILEGQSWGGYGAYELIRGKVTFGTDPSLDQNQIITDIHYAPINEDGLVLSSADIVILKPIDQSLSKVALVEVSNRGGKLVPALFLGGSGKEMSPDDPGTFGDGLLMQQGYTMIWIGWEFDVPESESNLNFHTPIARYPEGSPIIGRVRSDWTVDEDTKSLGLGHNQIIGYPAYDTNSALHVLTRRAGRNAPREVVNREDWSFGRLEGENVIPDDRSIYSAKGFEGGWIYELVYYAQNPPVVGLGLAAIRDIISYAKYENDCFFSVQHGLAVGLSQTGRFLRMFNYQGFNVDEEGRRAYDGHLTLVAGAGRGSFNHRFAQPSRDGHRYSAFLYPTDIYPFSGRAQTDPIANVTDGIMSRLDPGHRPKTFLINTGYEYWGRGASLIHTDPLGTKDVEPLDNERIYHLASGQHYVDAFPPKGDPSEGFYLGNHLEFRLNFRALLESLHNWVVDDLSPPTSNYPTIQSGELVPASVVKYPRMPGFKKSLLPHEPLRLDYGNSWKEGVIDVQPPMVGDAFVPLVPQVDALGNEVSGIRNIEIAVPLGSFIPYSLRVGMKGGNGEIATSRGSFVPLAFSESGDDDDRPAIRDLYVDKQDYLEKVRRHLDWMVEERYMLSQDIHTVMERASLYWNWATGQGESEESDIKIMSYNIRYDNEKDGESRWDLRKDLVVEVMSDEAPDFVGLQEALKHQCTFVQKELSGYKWVGVGREDGKQKGEHAPIFYNRKKWKLLDWGTFWLSETPEQPSKGWDAALPRIATHAKFENKNSKEVIFVVNTHYDHRGVKARVKSAELIRARIGSIAGEHRFLICGDFNIGPRSDGYLTLTEVDKGTSVYDARILSQSTPRGPKGTFSGFKVKDELPFKQIDYIFCSGGLSVNSFEVIQKERNGLYASDHFPVVATLTFRD